MCACRYRAIGIATANVTGSSHTSHTFITDTRFHGTGGGRRGLTVIPHHTSFTARRVLTMSTLHKVKAYFGMAPMDDYEDDYYDDDDRAPVRGYRRPREDRFEDEGYARGF